MSDYSYESELAGLADYLGEFGLGATPQTPQQARKAQLDAQMKAAQARQAAAAKKPATNAKSQAKSQAKSARVPPSLPAAPRVPSGPNPYGIVLPKGLPSTTPAPLLRTPAFDSGQAVGSANLLTTSISSVQQILNLYGAKLKIGGAFPGTQAAWQHAAAGKGLSPVIENAGGTQVRVNRETYAGLSAGPAKKQTPAKTAATPKASAKVPATSSPAPAAKLVAQAKAAPIKAVAGEKPTAPSRADLVKASIGTLQDIVRKLGTKVTRDGMFGAATKNAWAARAKAKKVDGVFDRAGPSDAWVDQTTFATLSKAAGFAGAQPTGAPPSADPESGGTPAGNDVPAAEDPMQKAVERFIAACTQQVDVLTVQQALMGTNMTEKAKGLFNNVGGTGSWDAPTQEGFIRVMGLTGSALEIFKAAQPQLMSSSRGGLTGKTEAIALVPAGAAKLEAAAAAYRKIIEASNITTGVPPQEYQGGEGPGGYTGNGGINPMQPNGKTLLENQAARVQQGEQQDVNGRRQRLRLVPQPSPAQIPDPVDTNPEIPTPAPTPMPGSAPAVFITAPAPAEQQTIPIYNNTTTTSDTTTTTTDSSGGNYNVPLLVGAGVLALIAFMHGKSGAGGAGAARGVT